MRPLVRSLKGEKTGDRPIALRGQCKKRKGQSEKKNFGGASLQGKGEEEGGGRESDR